MVCLVSITRRLDTDTRGLEIEVTGLRDYLTPWLRRQM